jgi:hypothetical protein
MKCFFLEFRPAYHNDYHGADVLQTTHCLLIKSNLLNIFPSIEITAVVRTKILCFFLMNEFFVVICCGNS